MSSTEPPSRIPPRGPNPSSKAERDDLSSKGRVEKVREVDADETRKRRFQKYYKDQHDADEASADEEANRPSPYDLISRREGVKSGLGDVEDAIVPGPSNSPPPNVHAEAPPEEPDEATEGALPQSEDFWEDVDFPPEHPVPPRSFKETHLEKDSTTPKAEKQGQREEERKYGAPLQPRSKEEKKGRVIPTSDQVKKEKKATPHTPERHTAETKKEPSPFGVPGKPERKREEINPSEKKSTKSPFAEEPAAPKARALHKEEERYLSHTEKEKKKEKQKEEGFVYQDPGMMPMRAEEREGGGGGKKEREHKIVEIQAPSLPNLPANIQPVATAAATQATPYLTPTTISLFYQMVGTMYVMAGPQGVTRTEIVLNNPAFAESKFFGATIKIEKYATAPDSFNVTLTGSNQAVVAFKENIPSLLTAFQNGNFSFRVNRIDVEYTTERPVFRRKEKGEERGEAGGGDLGERRK